MTNSTIVVLNPNSTTAVTDALDQSLDHFRFDKGPRIVARTLAEGPPGIETDQHVRDVEAPLCEHLARVERDSSGSQGKGGSRGAHVIACFSDPGIAAARQRLNWPVFGMAECGYLSACARAERFGVLSILSASIPRHLRYVEPGGCKTEKERLGKSIMQGRRLLRCELFGESLAITTSYNIGGG